MGGLSDLLMTRALLQEDVCVSICGTMRSICVWLMRTCHLKHSQHRAFVAACLKLSEPTHGGILEELLSRLLPRCFCQFIHPDAHLTKGRGCEGLCYAFLLASNLWLLKGHGYLKLFQTGQTTAISHGALFTQSLSFFLLPCAFSWKSGLWKGNNSWRKLLFFSPDIKFFHRNLIEITGMLLATGWPDLPCDSSSELSAGAVLLILSACFLSCQVQWVCCTPVLTRRLPRVLLVFCYRLNLWQLSTIPQNLSFSYFMDNIGSWGFFK